MVEEWEGLTGDGSEEEKKREKGKGWRDGRRGEGMGFSKV